MAFTDEIERLCQAVSQETDGEKLISLVDELNQVLQRTSEQPSKVPLPESAVPNPGKKPPQAA